MGETFRLFLENWDEQVPLSHACALMHAAWGTKGGITGLHTVATQMQWDISHNWSAVSDGYKLNKKDLLGKEGGVSLCVTKKWK